MSIYDLRDAFPYKGKEFSSSGNHWTCQLAEVSDLRPETDRLSWYLVFEPAGNTQAVIRKLELVTPGDKIAAEGFAPDLSKKIEDWLASGEQDGRVELL
jgi:hypothetical protein